MQKKCDKYYSHLVGLKFNYDYDRKTHGVFELDQWRVSLMQWLVPVPFRGERWLRIADIVWKPGKFSFLYFNGRNKFIAINDNLLSHNSIVKKEYEIQLGNQLNGTDKFGWDAKLRP